MSRWIIAIIVVASISGVAMAVPLLNKNLDPASRMRWVATFAVFESVIIAGLLAMWVLTGTD